MKPRRVVSLSVRVIIAALCVVFSATAPANAQFVPYYGKNKVKYDSFAWRVYRSPHFEIYYYPEFEQHLGRIVSYAESAYERISQMLKHSIANPIPLVLYKTHSEFEQTSLFPSFVPEGVAAFAEPTRERMVLPIDEAPDRLYGLITHELTHAFEFDLIPRGLMRNDIPLWVDEGLAEYMRGTWDALDLMMMREAAVTDQVPRLSRFEGYGSSPNARFVYNLGHAGFDFIEARYGKEGIRQFLYTLRKGALGGGVVEKLYEEAFKVEQREFDDAFDKWLKERFKPYRDKERPSDYGKDLSPDAETTPYTQVFAFSPSPTGEVVAVLTGNRSDGEADIALISARDGKVLRNLTRGYSGHFESVAFNDGFVAGRSIAFDPEGDRVAFFARTGKGRSLFFVSIITGRIVRQIRIPFDLPQSPCLSPDGQSVLFAGLQDGVSDIFLLDLKKETFTNLTQDSFRDSDPALSPDGAMVAYTRRISGHDKLFLFALAAPARKIQLTFGTHDDLAPAFARDGRKIYYSSNEDSEILNIRGLNLTTGVIEQHTDALGGNCAPAILAGKERDRIGFIAYAKGEYRLFTVELDRIVKEVEQQLLARQEESIDFEPDRVHRVITENKRGKRLFEKFMIEGRPPIDVGMTSSGDFFGGSQLALSDVLAEKNLTITALSEREYRSYDLSYFDLSRRLYWGLNAFDSTVWGYADPYGYLDYGFSRDDAIATRRVYGMSVFGLYPLDRLRRIQIGAGFVRERDGFASAEAEEYARMQAASLGLPVFLNSGSSLPLSLSFVSETTRFREFGPLDGSTVALSLMVSPKWGSLISRVTYDIDLRRYMRLAPTTVLALRLRNFDSEGAQPDYIFYGGNMELRGFDYRIFSGNKAFFANAELRFPLIDVMATPLGLMGPVRGTLFAGIGASRWKGQSFLFGTSRPGYSFINDSENGEPVTGFHLVDGRASYGIGLQLFLFGYPLHFDWSKLTDLRVVSKKAQFRFWIGYDF